MCVRGEEVVRQEGEGERACFWGFVGLVLRVSVVGIVWCCLP